MDTQRTTSIGSADELPAQIFLQPIAAPSILGLFGLAAGLFVLGAYWADWYGTANSPYYLFPFAALLGGLAQFVAGMWAFRARDGVATALHGVWGAFFLSYGLLVLLAAVGRLTLPNGAYVEFGYWLIALAAITWTVTLAALAENVPLAVVSFALAVGTTVLAIGYLIDNGTWIKVAGWVLVVASVFAWYTASALMVAGAFGRARLPFIRTGLATRQESRISVGFGEPGVVHGQ